MRPMPVEGASETVRGPLGSKGQVTPTHIHPGRAPLVPGAGHEEALEERAAPARDERSPGWPGGRRREAAPRSCGAPTPATPARAGPRAARSGRGPAQATPARADKRPPADDTKSRAGPRPARRTARPTGRPPCGSPPTPRSETRRPAALEHAQLDVRLPPAPGSARPARAPAGTPWSSGRAATRSRVRLRRPLRTGRATSRSRSPTSRCAASAADASPRRTLNTIRCFCSGVNFEGRAIRSSPWSRATARSQLTTVSDSLTQDRPTRFPVKRSEKTH